MSQRSHSTRTTVFWVWLSFESSISNFFLVWFLLQSDCVWLSVCGIVHCVYFIMNILAHKSEIRTKLGIARKETYCTVNSIIFLHFDRAWSRSNNLEYTNAMYKTPRHNMQYHKMQWRRKHYSWSLHDPVSVSTKPCTLERKKT